MTRTPWIKWLLCAVLFIMCGRALYWNEYQSSWGITLQEARVAALKERLCH